MERLIVANIIAAPGFSLGYLVWFTFRQRSETCEFQNAVGEHSVPKGDVKIVVLFCSDI